jgi:alkylation response protein AidB-like acyl-CoA dehydrogenase
MDLDLSVREEELGRAAAEIAGAFWKRRPDPDRALDRAELLALLKALGELGYLGSTIPRAAGGAGLTHVEMGRIIEGISGHFPFLGAHSVQRYLHHFADESQKARWLAPMLRGEILGAIAITEPRVGSDAGSVECRLIPDGDAYRLTGAKTWVTHGPFADVTVVTGSTDPALGARGVTRVLVDRSTPYAIEDIPALGLGHLRFSTFRFDRAAVPVAHRLGGEGDGLKGALTALPVARALAAVSAVGIAQAALDCALAYAKERTQFGRPIGAFQLVQEKIADMAAATRAARLLAYDALARLDKRRPAMAECSLAKFYATEAAVKVCGLAVAVLGANGLSRQYPVERHLRNAHMLLVPDGTAEINRLVAGRELLGLAAFR